MGAGLGNMFGQECTFSYGTISPRTSNMAGKLSGGKLSRGKLSASRFSIRSSERMDAHSNKYWSRGGIQIKETRN